MTKRVPLYFIVINVGSDVVKYCLTRLKQKPLYYGSKIKALRR